MSRLWWASDAQYPEDSGANCIAAETEAEAVQKALRLLGYSEEPELLSGESAPGDFVHVSEVTEADVDSLQEAVAYLRGSLMDLHVNATKALKVGNALISAFGKCDHCDEPAKTKIEFTPGGASFAEVFRHCETHASDSAEQLRKARGE